MPNWVKNIIEVAGDKNDIDNFLQKVRSDQSAFDFNQIIRMPDSLNMTSGGITGVAILYYISNRLKLTPAEVESLPDSKCLDTWFRKNIAEQMDVLREGIAKGRYRRSALYKDGKAYVENYRLYGATTRYDWSIYNWGTKWNSCETSMTRTSPNSCTITFDTAWSMPQPIIERMIERYPQLSFRGKFADEDLGYNCGKWASDNGKLCIYDTDNLRLACEVWEYDYNEVSKEYAHDV